MAYGFPFQQPRPYHPPHVQQPQQEHPLEPPSPEPQAPQTHPHTQPAQPSPPQRGSNPMAVLSNLAKQVDGDTLLLLAFLWLVAKEQCDKKLLLALCYILL